MTTTSRSEASFSQLLLSWITHRVSRMTAIKPSHRASEIGGEYCADCHVSHIVPDDLPEAMNEGVLGYAIDPKAAEALWKKSEEMVGESF